MAELEGYYCGLCGRLMPISHFPHSEGKQVTTMTEVHEDWGESYPYSDFKKGDVISYRLDGQSEHGAIIWVAAASILPSGREMPAHYIVANDKGGWPDSVFFSDVVMNGEPTLEYCPYCRGMHPKGTLTQCPLYNPNK